jgi:hypothetical protein
MIKYIQGVYIFDDKYKISSEELINKYKNSNTCFNPNNDMLLSQKDILQLENLAFTNNDNNLLNTINNLKYNNPPSPIKSVIYNDDNLFIKDQISIYNNNKKEISQLMYDILHIGLYFAGWNGREPYITKIKQNLIVNIELIIQPLIDKLYQNPHFDSIKDFPIINYLLQDNQYYPNIQNINIKIKSIIDEILNNEYTSSNFLITTTYYYLTTICNNSLTSLEPLIKSIS